MKRLFIFLALLITIYSFGQTRHTTGVILGDPSGTASDPTATKEGQIYWNSTLKKFRKFDGTVWSDLSVVSVSNLQTVTDEGDITDNNMSITSSGSPNFTVNKTDNSRSTAIYSDNIVFSRDAFNMTLQTPTLTGNQLITFQDGSGVVAFVSQITGEVNIIDTIVSPIDASNGTRIKPKSSAIDGYYIVASNNKASGYLVKSNNNTGNNHYTGYAVDGYGTTPFDNAMLLGIFGTNYYAPYLQNNPGLYFTGDLKIIGAKNTSDISFRLGNSATASPLESASNEVLTIASNRTITAPQLTNALVNSGGDQSLVTKKYVTDNFASQPLDEAYGISWNGDTTNSASRNAIYDKIETALVGGGESTTVSDTAEIDLTITGSDITADIVSASIDESKLDFSVNASLDKADTAIQTPHPTVVSSFTNDAGYLTSEVDGSVTNEIQVFDVSALVGTDLQLSLSNDGQATKTISLAGFSTGAHTVDTNTLGPDGNKGQITVGGTGTTLTINSGAVGQTEIATGGVATSEILNGTIDETDLDVSVNASLDLADSALQTEVDGSVSNELQTFDIATLSGTDLQLSLTQDAATAVVSLSGLIGTDDQTASEVTNTASGNLTSTNVQSSLVELQLDIDTRSVGAHTVDTNTLGSDGDKGDITVGGIGTTLTIDSGSVTGAKILNGTIDEVDLDASVNASLDLADSSLQVEVDGSITNEIQTGAQVFLTGYTLPGTTSAIASTDNVNQALGKLEKGLGDAISGGVTSVAGKTGVVTLVEADITDLTHTVDTKLTQEEVQDFVGSMVTTTNTETLITVTYQDATNDIDFVVDNNLANYSNATSNFSVGAHTTNTDSQTLTWTDATNTLAISGGNSQIITGFSEGAHTVDRLGPDGDKGDITVGGSGTTLNIDTNAIISSDILDGTITELDLNTTVNASLDKADSALQVEVDGSITNEIQTLSFTTPNLSISGGNSISLVTLQDGTGTDDQVASEVPNTAVGNLTSTNVQSSLAELQTDIDTRSVGAHTVDALGSDGNKGDITVGGTGTTLTINNGAVTGAKILNGTIDELDLDASVNASLDLADTALQSVNLTGLVPYTGATTHVDLGNWSIRWATNTARISGNSGSLIAESDSGNATLQGYGTQLYSKTNTYIGIDTDNNSTNAEFAVKRDIQGTYLFYLNESGKASLQETTISDITGAKDIITKEYGDTYYLGTGTGDMLLGTAQTVTAKKTFNTGTIGFRNPANTFSYNLLGSAIAADRSVTLPLLTGNDTFTMNSFAATLTNKTLTSPVINTQISGNVTSGGNITTTNYLLGATATQTLTNKTINASNNTLTGVATLAANQTFTGTNTYTSPSGAQSILINNGSTSRGIQVNNNSTGNGILVSNNSASPGLEVDVNSTGRGIYSAVYNAGAGITSKAVTGSSGLLYEGLNTANTSIFSVSNLGNVTGQNITANLGMNITSGSGAYGILGFNGVGMVGSTWKFGDYEGDDFGATIVGWGGNSSIDLGDGQITVVGDLNGTAGNYRANAFIKTGGTSSQFLKADGSVDTNTYVNSSGNTYVFATSNWGADNQILRADGGSTRRAQHSSPTIDDSGNITATNFILTSDERLKTNIEDFEVKPLEINWKTFEFKENLGFKRTGVIAQEIEKTNPEYVVTAENGLKAVDYIGLLIAKIAELEKRIEILENK